MRAFRRRVQQRAPLHPRTTRTHNTHTPKKKVEKGVAGLKYEPKRSPAWCDRVLYRSNLPHLTAVPGRYESAPEVATSDHKPVACAFDVPLGECASRGRRGA